MQVTHLLLPPHNNTTENNLNLPPNNNTNNTPERPKYKTEEKPNEDNLYIRFLDDKNNDFRLLPSENENAGSIARVRAFLPKVAKEGDILSFDRKNVDISRNEFNTGSGKISLVQDDIDKGYRDFEIPFYRDGNSIFKIDARLEGIDANDNSVYIKKALGKVLGSKEKTIQMSFVEDQNHNGHLEYNENKDPWSTATVRVSFFDMAKIGDVIKIHPLGGGIKQKIIDETDIRRQYVDFEVPLNLSTHSSNSGVGFPTKIVAEHGRYQAENLGYDKISETTANIIPEKFPGIPVENITITEDTDNDGSFRVPDTGDPYDRLPDHITAKIKLPSFLKEGDIVTPHAVYLDEDKKDVTASSYHRDHLLSSDDIQRGFITFNINLESYKNLGISVYVKRGDIEAYSKRNFDIDLGLPDVKEDDIVFLDDSNHDGRLSLAEMSTSAIATNPTTKIRIKIPRDANIGDYITCNDDKDREGNYITQDAKNKGYIDVDFPVRDKSVLNITSNITANFSSFRGKTSTKKVIIDGRIEHNLHFEPLADMQYVNNFGYNSRITNNDIDTRRESTKKVAFRLVGGEKLHDGYEVEFEVNGKSVKAHRVERASFGEKIYEADVNIWDIKNDPNHKVIAKLKNATYNEAQNDGTVVNVSAPEISAGTTFSLNLTSGVTTVSIEKFGNYEKNLVTLADEKNNADIPLRGRVLGDYTPGDNVTIVKPNGDKINVAIASDGSFSHIFKSSDFPQSTNFLNVEYTYHNKKYFNEITVDKSTKPSVFGLVPSFEIAEDNNSGLKFQGADPKLNEMHGAFNFFRKYTINIQDSGKIYDSDNGGKLKLNLDFGLYNTPYSKILRENGNLGTLGASGKEALSKITAGWKYEVYLLKQDMANADYASATSNNYLDGGYSLINKNPTKIFEGTIQDGTTHYSHEFNIKDYIPARNDKSELMSFYVKMIPPAGTKTYAHISDDHLGYNFSSDEILKMNDRMDHATSFSDIVTLAHVNVFSGMDNLANAYYDAVVPERIYYGRDGQFFTKKYNREFSKNFGKLLVSSDDANAFHYSKSIEEINISGFLYENPYNNKPASPFPMPGSDDHKHSSEQINWNGINIKPKEVYAVINGKRYDSVIDSERAYINIKGVKTLDLKNDEDHTIDFYITTTDTFGNDVQIKKQTHYEVGDVGVVTKDEIEKDFFLTGTDEFNIDRDRQYYDSSNRGDKSMVYSSQGESRIVMRIGNKLTSHFDYDFVLKIQNNLPVELQDQLVWYDPSDNKVKEILNGEILIKAGTNFKDIRIIQYLDNERGNIAYEILDSDRNEYGGITTYSNMAVKTKVITTWLKNAKGEKLSDIDSYLNPVDKNYDIVFNTPESELNLVDYVPQGTIENRKISIFNSQTSNYTVTGFESVGRGGISLEFLNDNLDVNLVGNSTPETQGITLNKMLLKKGNNIINMKESLGLKISDLWVTKDRDTEALLTFNRYDNSNISFVGKNIDFNNLHILKGLSNGNVITFEQGSMLGILNNTSDIYYKNLKIDETFQVTFSKEYGNYHINNFVLSSQEAGYTPEIRFHQLSAQPWSERRNIYIEDSTIAGNIVDATNIYFKNSVLGVNDENITTKIKLIGNFSIDENSSIVGPLEVSNTIDYGNTYFIDTTIDKKFLLTDTTNKVVNTYTLETLDNTFTFGSHAKIGSHATFNVDHSTMTFENGSVFEGTIKSGTNTNNFVIKAGATFNGTIEMADAINNITIEDGAILGPNFHITETNTESEAVNAKYDTLTLFNDIDFTNLDVKGLDQINIGTQARGEMINMDIVFDELNSLLGGGKNTIKFWGDSDNRLTFHNEANRTFAVAADQSAVASQPYTRYEASDTASGTKYFIDVHNDINLQIL